MEFFDISKCCSEASEVLHLHKRYLFQERALAGNALCPFRREWVWPDVDTALCSSACLLQNKQLHGMWETFQCWDQMVAVALDCSLNWCGVT